MQQLMAFVRASYSAPKSIASYGICNIFHCLLHFQTEFLPMSVSVKLLCNCRYVRLIVSVFPPTFGLLGITLFCWVAEIFPGTWWKERVDGQGEIHTSTRTYGYLVANLALKRLTRVCKPNCLKSNFSICQLKTFCSWLNTYLFLSLKTGQHFFHFLGANFVIFEIFIIHFPARKYAYYTTEGKQSRHRIHDGRIPNQSSLQISPLMQSSHEWINCTGVIQNDRLFIQADVETLYFSSCEVSHFSSTLAWCQIISLIKKRRKRKRLFHPSTKIPICFLIVATSLGFHRFMTSKRKKEYLCTLSNVRGVRH